VSGQGEPVWLPGVMDAIERVRALHRETSVEGVVAECLEGDCDHQDECPTRDFKVCNHCMDNADACGVDDWWPPFVMYPCATIRALDAGSVLALLNGGSDAD
jgi:hypothetical protein